jgi:hypothetical protein
VIPQAAISLDDMLRECAPEAYRHGLWVWGATPTHIFVGEQSIWHPLHTAVDRAALFTDPATREVTWDKIGRGIANTYASRVSSGA